MSIVYPKKAAKKQVILVSSLPACANPLLGYNETIMAASFKKLLAGYQQFRKIYAEGDDLTMHHLAYKGQKPQCMVVACCDSRVDPALILQCEPGDLFVARNVANIVPPYEPDAGFHGTSAALEFGLCYLDIKHLIILGHSKCGGIEAALDGVGPQDDFISHWVSNINVNHKSSCNGNELAKESLLNSHKNCLTFPWIKQRIDAQKLQIHLWYFDIEDAEISAYDAEDNSFQKLAKTSTLTAS